jgi:hypothetical protein
MTLIRSPFIHPFLLFHYFSSFPFLSTSFDCYCSQAFFGLLLGTPISPIESPGGHSKLPRAHPPCWLPHSFLSPSLSSPFSAASSSRINKFPVGQLGRKFEWPLAVVVFPPAHFSSSRREAIPPKAILSKPRQQGRALMKWSGVDLWPPPCQDP